MPAAVQDGLVVCLVDRHTGATIQVLLTMVVLAAIGFAHNFARRVAKLLVLPG